MLSSLPHSYIGQSIQPNVCRLKLYILLLTFCGKKEKKRLAFGDAFNQRYSDRNSKNEQLILTPVDLLGIRKGHILI